MIDQTGLGFAELNRLRRYPLADDATTKDTTNTIALPNDFLVGLVLTVPSSLLQSPDRYFLGRLVISNDTYILGLWYTPASGSPSEIATVSVSKSGHTPYQAYPLAGTGILYQQVSGHAQVGVLSTIDALPPGMWLFNAAGGKLDPTAVRFALPTVSSLVIVGSDGQTTPLYGDITLAPGVGTSLRVTSAGGGNFNVLIDFVGTAAAQPSCPCDQPNAIPITSIAGIQPGPDGNFNLQAGSCITLTPLTAGLSIANPCSTPCYNCTDLVTLTGEQDTLTGYVNSLQLSMSQVESELSRLQAIVAAGA